jgi:hypothetical protein
MQVPGFYPGGRSRKVGRDEPQIYGRHRLPIRIVQQYAGITCVMLDLHSLALRQADQARTDSTAMESELEVIQVQPARLPTRRDLAKAALGIIFATEALVILWAEAFC